MRVWSRSGMLVVSSACAVLVALVAAVSVGSMSGADARSATALDGAGGAFSGSAGTPAMAFAGGMDLSAAIAGMSPGWEGVPTTPDKLRRVSTPGGWPGADGGVAVDGSPSPFAADPGPAYVAPADGGGVPDQIVPGLAPSYAPVGSTPPAVEVVGYDPAPQPTATASPTPVPTPAPVSAVPEPATWLSMILGMALVGAMLRRRRSAEPSSA